MKNKTLNNKKENEMKKDSLNKIIKDFEYEYGGDDEFANLLDTSQVDDWMDARTAYYHMNIGEVGNAIGPMEAWDSDFANRLKALYQG